MGAEPILLVDCSPGSRDRRLLRVQQTIGNPIFGTVLRRRLTESAPVKDYERLRDITNAVLADDFGLDLAGVSLKFSWDGAGQLVIRPREEVTREQVEAVLSTRQEAHEWRR